MILARVLTNMLDYVLDCWNIVRQDVDALFGEDDETLSYVLAWVTALYIKNMAELNTEASETPQAKASAAVSKQAMLNAPANALIDESAVEMLIEIFDLENYFTEEFEIDAGYLLDNFDIIEGFPGSAYTLEELLFPEELQDRMAEMVVYRCLP